MTMQAEHITLLFKRSKNRVWKPKVLACVNKFLKVKKTDMKYHNAKICVIADTNFSQILVRKK